MRRVKGILVFALVAWVVWTCRDPVTPEAPDFVAYAWELFAEQDYRGSIRYFREGTGRQEDLADGWNGQGWAYARLGVADTSKLRFNRASAYLDTSIVGTEIYAGRSFTRLALGEYDASISDVRQALGRAPLWRFRRDTTITYRKLLYTAATAFYSQGKFDSSLTWVQRLDSDFSADVGTLGGRSELAAKLEDLSRDLVPGP